MSSIYTIKNRATGNNIVYLGVENAENEALLHLNAIEAPENNDNFMLYVKANANNNRIQTESRDKTWNELMNTESFATFANSLKKSDVTIDLAETYDAESEKGFIYKITLQNKVATNIPGNTDPCSGKYIFLTDGHLKEQFILVNSADTIATNYISSYRYFIVLFIPDKQARYNIGYNTLTRDEDVYTIEIDNKIDTDNETSYHITNVVSLRKIQIKRNENDIANEIVASMQETRSPAIHLLSDLNQSSIYSDDGSMIAIAKKIGGIYQLYIAHPKQILYTEISKETYYNDSTPPQDEEAKYYQIVTDTTKYASNNGTGDISKYIKYQVSFPGYYSGYKDFMGVTSNGNVNIVNYYAPGVAEKVYTNTGVIGFGPQLFKNIAFSDSPSTINENNTEYKEYVVSSPDNSAKIKNKNSSKFMVEKSKDNVYNYDFKIEVSYDLTKQYDIKNIGIDKNLSDFNTFVKTLSGTAVFEIPIPITPLNKLYYYAASANIDINNNPKTISSQDTKDTDIKIWYDSSEHAANNSFDYEMFMAYKYKKRAADEQSLRDALLEGIEIEPAHTNGNYAYNDGLIIMTSLLYDNIDKINYMGSTVGATVEIYKDDYTKYVYNSNEYMLIGIDEDQFYDTKKIQVTFKDYTNEEITNPIILSWDNVDDRPIINALNNHNNGTGYNQYSNNVRALTLKDIKDITTDTEGFFAGNTDITNFDKFEYFIGLNTAHPHIPYYTFENCTNLTSIKLPHFLTLDISGADFRKTIPGNTFKGCTSLETIEIPEYITTIGPYAFEGCVNLKNIDLSHVKQIYDGAFKGCTSLTSVDLQSYEKDGNNENAIGSFMFQGCTSLSKVILPATNNIETIKQYAFDGCTSLYSINLSNSLIKIEKYAFAQCSNFDLQNVPNDLQIIENNAFDGCTRLSLGNLSNNNKSIAIGSYAFHNCISLKLTSLNINGDTISVGAFKGCTSLALNSLPDNVKVIDDYAFTGCTNLPLKSLPSNLTTIGESAFKGCINIELTPESKLGQLTTIGHRAFCGCTKISFDTLPSNVTTIGVEAFMDCTNLKLKELPNNITKIDTRAFKNCTNIDKNLSKIPKGVTQIWDEAFYGCEYIEEIHIPSTVEYIHSRAFCKCYGLSKIYSYREVAPHIESDTFSLMGEDIKLYIPLNSSGYEKWPGYSNILMTSVSNNPVFTVCKDADWCTEFANISYDDNYKSGIEMISNDNAMSVVDAKAVNNIGIIFQNNTAIKTFNEFAYFTGVEGISDYAFSGCSSLATITIPDSVTSIGEGAFNECSSLTSITIPNSVNTIGIHAFQNCDLLTSITIPSLVTSISDYMLCGCESLQTVNLLGDIKSIRSDAFSGCGNLQTINLPGTVTTIGQNAFYNCTSLNSISIPNSVTSIGSKAFAFCEVLDNIVIPNSVENVGSEVFYNCEALSNITIGNSVTSIGNGMFNGCASLTSIEIPDSVTSIGDDAFNGCIALTEIEIPNSVKSIGAEAFSGCTALTEIEIPSSVTSIGDGAFSGCTALTSFPIPSTVTSIGNRVFSNCKALTKVDIPYKVTSIGDYAFSGCTALTEFDIPDSVISIGEYTFSNCTALEHINKVKSRIPTSYYNIGYYSNILPKSIKTIGKGAFQNCSSIVNIFLPNNEEFETISAETFDGCTNLRFVLTYTKDTDDVELDWGISEIGAYAFRDCVNLGVISNTKYNDKEDYGCKIPNTVTSIGQNAFENCTSITKVYIVGLTDEIGNYAFYNCSALTNIYLGLNFDSIGNAAFADCNMLENITSYSLTPTFTINTSSVFSGHADNCNTYIQKDAYGATYKTWPGTKQNILTINSEGDNWIIFSDNVKVIKQSSTSSTSSTNYSPALTPSTGSETESETEDQTSINSPAQSSETDTSENASTNTATNTATNTVTNSVSTEEETNTSTNNTTTSTSDDSTTEDTTNTTTNSVSYTEYETESTNTTTNTTSETEEETEETNTTTNATSNE